ncbi:MAG: hypothetical protein ABFS56_03910 [Pseudomonadota bacterium]
MGKIKKKKPAKFIKGIRINDYSHVSTQQEHPIFCLKYLDKENYSLSACTKEQKAAFAETLFRLSQLTWTTITNSPRHGLGYEKIARTSIRAPIPVHLTDDVTFIAFRFYGKAPMVGYRDGSIFHILWIDRDFTLYSHG